MPLRPAVARFFAGAAISTIAIIHNTAMADEAKAQATLRAASLAATCANCHGTNGQGVEGSAVTGLANLSVEYIKTNMIWFKTGQRPATVMHQLAKGYTDEQIDIIANHLGKKD
ncbi:MAG TPA: c-type cytochrome [Limnobacter sp.]|nr:c-type cytochrome [Limnobacter sp.]